MLRRLHVPILGPGRIVLDAAQAHHARSVLRLAQGAPVEVFDNSGRHGAGLLDYEGPNGAAVSVRHIDDRPASRLELCVTAAVPKGERADWMVEKLSELGVDAFVPLAASRSVVVPGGTNKIERWARIAMESAKQSRRTGVMRIDPLMPVPEALARGLEGGGTCWCLSPDPAGLGIEQATLAAAGKRLTLFVGPEGGWSYPEDEQMRAAGILRVRLTQTVLRVETAAIAAAAFVAIAHPREQAAAAPAQRTSESELPTRRV